jgi:hypothetical protein
MIHSVVIANALTPAHASPPAAATSPLLPVAVRVGLSIGALPLIPPGGITFSNTLAPLIVGVPVATSVPVPGTLKVIADGLNAFTPIA